MVRTRLLALGLALTLAAYVLAVDPPNSPRTIALTGALIHTQTDAGDFVGTIVIRDGKIIAVGPDAAFPPDAKVIDAAKCVITPGLIDAHGTLGLNSSAAAEGGRDATLNILDAVDPFS